MVWQLSLFLYDYRALQAQRKSDFQGYPGCVLTSQRAALRLNPAVACKSEMVKYALAESTINSYLSTKNRCGISAEQSRVGHCRGNPLCLPFMWAITEDCPYKNGRK